MFPIVPKKKKKKRLRSNHFAKLPTGTSRKRQNNEKFLRKSAFELLTPSIQRLSNCKITICRKLKFMVKAFVQKQDTSTNLT